MVRVEWTGRFKIFLAVAVVLGARWLADRNAARQTFEGTASAALFAAVGLICTFSANKQKVAKGGLLLIALSAAWLFAIVCQWCGLRLLF